MSNETKRDVFDGLLKEHCKTILDLNPASAETDVKQIVENVFRDRYAAAMPDDLPVIPEAVGEYIKSNRTEPLGKVFWHLGCISAALLGSTRSYIVDHSEDFARAWVLGAWCVEETGEIMKLEAEE